MAHTHTPHTHTPHTYIHTTGTGSLGLAAIRFNVKKCILNDRGARVMAAAKARIGAYAHYREQTTTNSVAFGVAPYKALSTQPSSL